MRIDRILIAFGILLLVIAVFSLGSSWFTNMLDMVPTEADQVPEWIARLITGVIAVFSLTVASYLALQEWRKAKHRGVKVNEEKPR